MGEGGPGRFGLVGTGPTPIPLEGSSAASSLHLGPLGRARHRAFGAPTARGPSGPGDHPPPACGRPVSAVQAGATRAARSTARFPPARFRAGRDPGTSGPAHRAASPPAGAELLAPGPRCADVVHFWTRVKMSGFGIGEDHSCCPTPHLARSQRSKTVPFPGQPQRPPLRCRRDPAPSPSDPAYRRSLWARCPDIGVPHMLPYSVFVYISQGGKRRL